MKPEDITEKLEQLASAAERESMCANTMHLRSIQLRGYIEGLRDAMKVFNGENNGQT
jgi:hypothetical protein